MRLLDLTLPTPAENLALDEALLEAAEESAAGEALRIWESPEPVVVIGRAGRRSEEAELAYCAARGIPVFRRSSGGGAIVMGPGCLMYAVVLSLEVRPELRMIDAAHRFVLGRLGDALATVIDGVEMCGISDLAQMGPKFSGNSQRVRRTHLLYHGTLLYDFPLDLVQSCLRPPPRQPEYRAGRDHTDFVANLPLSRQILHDAARAAFPTSGPLTDWPRTQTAQLAAEKYSQEAWNDRLP